MLLSVTVEQVRATVSAAVGEAVALVRRLPGSVANQDFVATLANGQKVVLKAGPTNEIAAEGWVCRRLAAAGMPVPALIAMDISGTEFELPYLILTFMEGKPSEDSIVARAGGAWLRRVHSIELPGWGPLVIERDQVTSRGRHQSSREAISDQLSGLPQLVAAGVIDSALGKAAQSLVEVEELLGYEGPGVLLHNDLKPDHLLGRHDGHHLRLSAIIDWGDAAVGDPAADLARLSMARPAVTDAFLEGYGVPMSAELQNLLARYRLLWNIRALSYEYRAGGDWFDVYRARIMSDIAQLSR